MTVLIDTSVLYADADTDAARHQAAEDALEAVYAGELGQPYVSDYVYDETTTLTLRRTGDFEAARAVGRSIRGTGDYTEVYDLLHVTPQAFDAAVEVFERYDDQRLSFTDATSVALARRRGIDGVLSFDDDFDGVVERIDPASL